MDTLEHILAMVAVALGLIGAVLFLAMVVVGEVVIIVRWLKHLHEIPNPYRSGLGKRWQ
jgi:hypothetical protein